MQPTFVAKPVKEPLKTYYSGQVLELAKLLYHDAAKNGDFAILSQGIFTNTLT